MKFFKLIFILVLIPILISSVAHKFYVSTTKVEYIKEQKSIQIISKMFVEDLEQVLQERYSPNIVLDPIKETESDKNYLKKYISKKLKFTVNGELKEPTYIGKEYDIDIVNMYFEIEGVEELNSLEIENKVLLDKFPEQQNIIHFINGKNKRNLILDKDHPNGLLNFN